MIRLGSSISTKGVPIVLGLAIAGAGVVGIGRADPTNSATPMSGPLRCEIRVTPIDGGVALEGIARADTALAGTYSFRVVGSGGAGRSSIEQGGSFNATPNAPTVLGKVMLGNDGAAYDVRLRLNVDGDHVECSRQIDTQPQRTGPIRLMPNGTEAVEAPLAPQARTAGLTWPPINDG